MQYRSLGNTGIDVSEIGFGAWAIGGVTSAGGVPLGWGRTVDDESMAAVRRALELGVTFFDTADIYGHGRSESLLGIVLSRRRSEVVIATKVGVVRTSSGDHIRDFSKRHIFLAADASLRRLRSDYIDVYQLQNPSIEDLRREEVQEAMSTLQSLGKIKVWGASISKPEEGIEIVSKGWGYTLQVLYNILNQSPAETLFPLARKAGYGIIARVPLASGLLTGKYRPETSFAPDDIRQNYFTPRRLEEALERVDEVRSIVGGATRTLSDAALRFALGDGAVSTVIPGAKNAHQVELNAAASAAVLPEEVMQKLRTRLGSYNFYERHSIRV